jgi:hypothetical protein
MTTEEIRAIQQRLREGKDDDGKPLEDVVFVSRAFWLAEIAAQLAEWNERNARAEKKAMEIADRSMGLIERSEKSMDELDEKKKRDRSLV